MPHTHSPHYRSQQNPCPSGVPIEIWFNITARYKALNGPAIELLRERGPLDSHQIAQAVCPGLNAGRMGEVMNILRKQGRVIRTKKIWQLS